MDTQTLPPISTSWSEMQHFAAMLCDDDEHPVAANDTPLPDLNWPANLFVDEMYAN